VLFCLLVFPPTSYSRDSASGCSGFVYDILRALGGRSRVANPYLSETHKVGLDDCFLEVKSSRLANRMFGVLKSAHHFHESYLMMGFAFQVSIPAALKKKGFPILAAQYAGEVVLRLAQQFSISQTLLFTIFKILHRKLLVLLTVALAIEQLCDNTDDILEFVAAR
jgi:hypothetical protein